MKTILKLYASLALASSLDAAVLTVDNNPGAVAQYNNFASAYEAAADGDTILLAGSSFSYGGHELYKRLIIIGSGYFLNENQIPGFSKRQAIISLYARHNPTLGSSANSRFIGLEGVLRSEVGTDGLVVDRCKLLNDSNNNTDFFGGQATISSCSASTPDFSSGISRAIRVHASGSIVRNSIMSILWLGQGAQASNCVILALASTSPLTSVTNSIFTRPTPNLIVSGEGIISHCIDVTGSRLPSGNGNVNGPFIINNVILNTGSDDAKWQLKPGSPAIGTGTGGADMGAFGGASPYRISGIPGIPRLTRLDVPPTATSTSGLRFEVSAQAFGE